MSVISMRNLQRREQVILGVDPGTTVMGYGVIKTVGNKATLLTMGVIDFKDCETHYDKLNKIFTRVTEIINEFDPEILSIEAPFYGKNVQSMLKLGRAQGVAITPALLRDIPITEYAPLKIKMAITGNGSASKEQVASMLERMLRIPKEMMPKHLDATDGLAAAYCHFLQSNRPETTKKYSNWKDFIAKNPDKIS